MKRGLRVLLPAIALVVLLLSVDGAAKPKSASADWPGYCAHWSTSTTYQWQWSAGYWQWLPVTKQVCTQWVNQPYYFNYYGYMYNYVQPCSAYFLYNLCGVPYANCSTAYIDPWGNRYTCFGVQYGVWNSGGVVPPSWGWH